MQSDKEKFFKIGCWLSEGREKNLSLILKLLFSGASTFSLATLSIMHSALGHSVLGHSRKVSMLMLSFNVLSAFMVSVVGVSVVAPFQVFDSKIYLPVC